MRGKGRGGSGGRRGRVGKGGNPQQVPVTGVFRECTTGPAAGSGPTAVAQQRGYGMASRLSDVPSSLLRLMCLSPASNADQSWKRHAFPRPSPSESARGRYTRCDTVRHTSRGPTTCGWVCSSGYGHNPNAEMKTSTVLYSTPQVLEYCTPPSLNEAQGQAEAPPVTHRGRGGNPTVRRLAPKGRPPPSRLHTAAAAKPLLPPRWGWPTACRRSVDARAAAAAVRRERRTMRREKK